MENLDLGIQLGILNDNKIKDLSMLIDYLYETILKLNNLKSEDFGIFTQSLSQLNSLKSSIKGVKEEFKKLQDFESKSSIKGGGNSENKKQKLYLTQQMTDIVKVTNEVKDNLDRISKSTGRLDRKIDTNKLKNLREYIELLKEEVEAKEKLVALDRKLGKNQIPHVDYGSSKSKNKVNNVGGGAGNNPHNTGLNQINNGNSILKMFGGLDANTVNSLSKGQKTGFITEYVKNEMMSMTDYTTSQIKEFFNTLNRKIESSFGSEFHRENPKYQAMETQYLRNAIKQDIARELVKQGNIYSKNTDKNLSQMNLNELNKYFNEIINNQKTLNSSVNNGKSPISTPNFKEIAKESNSFINEKMNNYTQSVENKVNSLINKKTVLEDVRDSGGALFFAKEVVSLLNNTLGLSVAKEFEKNVTALGVSGNFKTSQGINSEKSRLIYENANTPFSTNEFVGNIREVIKTGRDYEQSMNIVRGATRIAVTSFDDLTTATEILNGQLLALDLDATTDRIDRFTKRLYNALDNTALDLADVSGAGRQSNTVMNALVNMASETGIQGNIEDYAEKIANLNLAIIGSLRQQGKSGEQAGTVERNMLTKLAQLDNVGKKRLDDDLRKATPELLNEAGFRNAQEMMEKMKTDVFSVLNGLSLLQSKGVLAFSTISKMFTERHASSVSSLLTTINGDVDKFIDNITTGKDLISNQSKAMENWGTILERITTNFQDLSKLIFSNGATGIATGGVITSVDTILNSYLKTATGNNLLAPFLTALPQFLTFKSVVDVGSKFRNKSVYGKVMDSYNIYQNLANSEADYTNRQNTKVDFLQSMLGSNKGFASRFKGGLRLMAKSSEELALIMEHLQKTGQEVTFDNLVNNLKNVQGVLDKTGKKANWFISLLQNNAWLIALTVGLNLVTKFSDMVGKNLELEATFNDYRNNLIELGKSFEVFDKNMDNIIFTPEEFNNSKNNFSALIDSIVSKNKELQDSLNEVIKLRDKAFLSREDMLNEKLNKDKEGQIKTLTSNGISRKINDFMPDKYNGMFREILNTATDLVSGDNKYHRADLLALNSEFQKKYFTEEQRKKYNEAVDTYKDTGSMTKLNALIVHNSQQVNESSRFLNKAIGDFSKETNKVWNAVEKETKNLKNKEDKELYQVQNILERFSAEQYKLMFGNVGINDGDNQGIIVNKIMRGVQDTNKNGSNEDEIANIIEAQGWTNERKQMFFKAIKAQAENIKDVNEEFTKRMESITEFIENSNKALEDMKLQINNTLLKDSGYADIIQYEEKLKEKFSDVTFRQSKLFKDPKNNKDQLYKLLTENGFTNINRELFDREIDNGNFKKYYDNMSKGDRAKLNNLKVSQLNGINQEELNKLNQKRYELMYSIDPMYYKINRENVNNYQAQIEVAIQTEATRQSEIAKLKEKQEELRTSSLDADKKEYEANKAQIEKLEAQANVLEDTIKLSKTQLFLSTLNIKSMQELSQDYYNMSVSFAQYNNTIANNMGYAFAGMNNSMAKLNSQAQMFSKYTKPTYDFKVQNANEFYGNEMSKFGITNSKNINYSNLLAVDRKIMEMQANNINVDSETGLTRDKIIETAQVMKGVYNETLQLQQQQLAIAQQEKDIQWQINKYWLDKNKLMTINLRSNETVQSERDLRDYERVMSIRGDKTANRTEDILTLMDMKLANSNLRMKDSLDYAKRQIEVSLKNNRQQLEALRRLEQRSIENAGKVITVIPDRVNTSLVTQTNELKKAFEAIEQKVSNFQLSNINEPFSDKFFGNATVNYATQSAFQSAQNLIAYRETGSKNSNHTKSIGNISVDTGNSKSYGTYGFNNKTGSLQEFLRTDGAKFNLPKNIYSKEFDSAWKRIATMQSKEFAQAQDNFQMKKVSSFFGKDPSKLVREKFGVSSDEDVKRIAGYLIDASVQYWSGGLSSYVKKMTPKKDLKNVEQVISYLSNVEKNNIDSWFGGSLKSGSASKRGLVNSINKRANYFTYDIFSDSNPNFSKMSKSSGYVPGKNLSKEIDKIRRDELTSKDSQLMNTELIRQQALKLISDNNLSHPQKIEALNTLKNTLNSQYKADDFDANIINGVIDEVISGLENNFETLKQTFNDLHNTFADAVKNFDFTFGKMRVEFDNLTNTLTVSNRLFNVSPLITNMQEAFYKFQSSIASFDDYSKKISFQNINDVDLQKSLERLIDKTGYGLAGVKKDDDGSLPTSITEMSANERILLRQKFLSSVIDNPNSLNNMTRETYNELNKNVYTLGLLLGREGLKGKDVTKEQIAQFIEQASDRLQEGKAIDNQTALNVLKEVYGSDITTYKEAIQYIGGLVDSNYADLEATKRINEQALEWRGKEIENVKTFNNILTTMSDNFREIAKSLTLLDLSSLRTLRENNLQANLLSRGISLNSNYAKDQMERLRYNNAREELAEATYVWNTNMKMNPLYRSTFKQMGFDDNQIDNLGLTQTYKSVENIIKLLDDYTKTAHNEMLRRYQELMQSGTDVWGVSKINIFDENQRKAKLEELERLSGQSGENLPPELNNFIKLLTDVQSFNENKGNVNLLIEDLTKVSKAHINMYQQTTEKFSQLYKMTVDTLGDMLFGTEGDFKPFDYKASLDYILGGTTGGLTSAFSKLSGVFNKKGLGNANLNDENIKYENPEGSNDKQQFKTDGSTNGGQTNSLGMLFNAMAVYDGIIKKELNSKLKSLKVQEEILKLNLQIANTAEERRKIEQEILQNKLNQIDTEYNNKSSFMGMSTGSSGFAMQGALSGATQGATIGGGFGALVGAGLGLIGGLTGGTNAKIQANQQKAMLIAQQKTAWLMEDNNRYLKTMTNLMSEQAKWVTKVGVNDAINRSVRMALNNADTIGGTAIENRTVQKKQKKGGGLFGSKKYDEVETFTASYNLNDAMFGGKKFENKQDLEYAYSVLAKRLLVQASGGNFQQSRLERSLNPYIKNLRQRGINAHYINTAPQTTPNGLGEYLDYRMRVSSRELSAGEFLKYFNGQGTLAGDNLLVDKSRDHEIDAMIERLKASTKGMDIQSRINTEALIKFYQNIKAVLDKEGKTTKRLFGNYYGIDTEEVKDEKGNITEYRRVNESKYSQLYQEIFSNIMNGAKDYSVGSDFIKGTTNAFIQNVSSSRNNVKAITEEFNKLADQIYDVVTRTGEFTNVNGSIKGLIDNMEKLRQSQKESEKFTVDLAKRWVGLGGNITDVIKDMNNGLTTAMDSIKSGLLGSSMEETINNFGNNLFTKLGDSMTKNLINKKYANDIFNMNDLLKKAQESNSIDDIVKLSQAYKGNSAKIENDRERMNAIRRLFTANRDIDYVDEAIQYQTGTSQSITQNFNIKSEVTAGTVVADQLSIEQLADKLLPPIIQAFRDLNLIRP